ncbi:MAG: hypothetical protein DI605_15385 [Sphingomonas sp.]|nr:MAG: hypothetical protein DI605_15385 [Sphingomonas sp.]
MLAASALFVGIALMFAAHASETPQTMIAAARAAMMIALLGLCSVAHGMIAEADGDAPADEPAAPEIPLDEASDER